MGLDQSSMRPDKKTSFAAKARRPGGSSLLAFRAEIAFAVGLTAYAVMAFLAHRYAYFEWDLQLARVIQSVELPAFRSIMFGLSALGSGWLAYAIVIVCGVALMLARMRIEGLLCMAGTGLGSLIERGLKLMSGRPRPSADLVEIMTSVNHESFPSGHVVFFIHFFGFLFFLAYALLPSGWPRWVVMSLTGGLIALIGVSRVYLGAHWPSDVAGAYLAGGLWLVVMIEVYRRIKARQRSQP